VYRSFMERVGAFARSSQGRRVVNEAKRLARDPGMRRRIELARRRLQGDDEPAKKR